jgi:MFS family permease
MSQSGWSKWLVVACLWVAFALNYIDRQAAFSIFPVLQKELGFSNSQLGLVGGLFIWLYALCMPVAGYIADRIRRDLLIVAAMVMWSITVLGTALCHSPSPFLAWRAATGITEALYYPAAVGLLAALHPGPTRSRALGIHQSAQMIGVVGGGWFGGWAGDHIGWRQGFGVLFLIGVAYAAFLLFVFRAWPAERDEPAKTERLPNRLPRSPVFWALLLVYGWFCAIQWIVYAWLPDHLYERFGYSLTASGYNATVFIQFTCLTGVVLGAWLADHLVKRIPAGRLYLTGIGFFLSAPCAYLMFSVSTIGEFRFFALTFGLLSGLNVGNGIAAAYDVVHDKNYSFAGGVYNMAGGASAAAGMWLGGVLKKSLGLSGLVAISAAITMATAVFFLVVIWRRFDPHHNVRA